MALTFTLATLLGVPLFTPFALGVPSGDPAAVVAPYGQPLVPRAAANVAALGKSLSTLSKAAPPAKPPITKSQSLPVRPPPKTQGTVPQIPKLSAQNKKQAKHVAIIGGKMMCVGGDILQAIPVEAAQAAGKAVGSACGGADGVIDAHNQLKKGATPKVSTHRRRRRNVAVSGEGRRAG